MNWLYKLERRFGRFGIPNLMLYVAAGQAIVWLVIMFAYYPLYFLLSLNRSGLFAGQVWRLVSFVFLPPLTTNPIYVALEIYLLYWLGSALERTWGSFKFTVYFLLGIVGAWLGCLITGSAGNTALYYSLFFAFAYLYPETQLLLFFVVPVKVKWLGWISAVLYLLQWIVAPLVFWASGSSSARAASAGCARRSLITAAVRPGRISGGNKSGKNCGCFSGNLKTCVL